MGRLGIAVAVAVLLAATACSDDADEAGSPSPAASPTAPGDPARIEVLESGAEPRRVLRLAPQQGAAGTSTLVLDQLVAADQQVTDTPPVTVTLETSVGAVDDDGVAVILTYADVRVEDVALGRTLAVVEGANDQVVVGADGTPASSGTGDTGVDATVASVTAQVLSLLPVLPGEAVGAGATWTVRSVVDVDGATVDRTATYTLDALEDERYVIGVAMEQQYRTGEVEGVEVSAGRGTVSGRFEGSLSSLLPDSASLDLSTQVSYVVGGRVTEVSTTVGLDLAAG